MILSPVSFEDPSLLGPSSLFAAFFAASIAISLLTLVLLFLLRGGRTILHFGAKPLRLFVLLLIARGFLPIEFYTPSFPFTFTIYSKKLLPALRDLLLAPIWHSDFFTITPALLLVFLWTGGLSGSLLSKLQGYFSCAKVIYTLPEVLDADALSLLQEVWKSLFPHKKASIRLVRAAHFCSPAIWGIRNPVIILPNLLYTLEELRYIFFHELLHYKHRDFLLKLSLDALLSIHWWNPFLTRCLMPAVTQTQELLVDEHLTRTLCHAEKAKYLEVLSKTLCFQKNMISQNPEQLYTLADRNCKRAVLQRLHYIIDPPAKRFFIRSAALCMVLFLLSYSFIFDTYYEHITDEDGERVFQNIEGQTFYIKNGELFDLYMQNEYVGSFPQIVEDFKNVPVYNNIAEVHIL